VSDLYTQKHIYATNNLQINTECFWRIETEIISTPLLQI